MRIVYLITSLGNPAGMERVLCTKVNYLVEKTDCSVQIIVKNPLPNDIFYNFSNSIIIESLSLVDKTDSKLGKLIRIFKRDNIYRKKLSDRLNFLKPDITISMFGEELSFLHELNDGSIKITEFHYSRNYLVQLIKNIPELRFRSLRILYAYYLQYRQRKVAQKYHKVILLSNRDKHLWGNKTNLTVIPNPVSFTIAKIAALKNKQIIAIGRFIAQKGFDLLIESFSFLANEFPDWTLLIIGEGQDQEYLEKKINESNLIGRIKLKAPVKNIEKELLDSSILAFPSRYEGFGLVLTEAMECGVPCVSFDCECGPSEIISHGEDGFLVENGNDILFAEYLKKLMKDDTLRFKMGKAAKNNVKRFYVENVMEKWLEIFDEMQMNNRR